MSLTDLYESASPCIVGFMSRMVQAPVGQPPPFPEIIGTGFLVTSDGVVATNRHVVEALWRLPQIPGTQERVGGAFIFMVSNDKLGGQVLNLKIRDVAALQGFWSLNDWYGQDVPDVGLVQLEITGMPFLELATDDFSLRPGMEIATMGYPLGTQPLVSKGKVNQLGPFIRRGIVSSVYPFSSPQPHGFTIDIMQQGGSSGSPIFAGDSPLVVGMMWGGVQEPRVAQSPTTSLMYTLNTNISVAEPSDIIKDALTNYLSTREPLDQGIPSLQQLVERYPRSLLK
jgi:S1-C subfamily serine protease